jgi:hypothetical protein
MAGEVSNVSRTRRKFDCLPSSGNGLIVDFLKQQD